MEGNREHTQEEIDKLLELQSNGHEIAHHGFLHHKAEGNVDIWIAEEIERLFTWMNKQSDSTTKEGFKKPVSFAFPHFVYTDEHVNRLIPQYFKIVRGHLNTDHLTPFNHTGFAPSICLDGYYSYSLYYIKKIMKLLKQSGKNIIFTCHSILPENHKEDNSGWAAWQVSPQLIKKIIIEAKKNNLAFYTTSEIAGIANFIDHNLEKEIRMKMGKSSSNWIEIAELQQIKELDLRNKGISNIDGLEYFLNLEKINLSHNQISDFRILEKLPKLHYANIDHNKPIERRKIAIP